jgi:hypothetical protein
MAAAFRGAPCLPNLSRTIIEWLTEFRGVMVWGFGYDRQLAESWGSVHAGCGEGTLMVGGGAGRDK